MADGEVVKVELRRRDTSQGWGFRMRGGAQVNMPLFIEAVNPKGRSFHAGLRGGDGILCINNEDVTRASHEQAKGAMLRAGNEIDLLVKRGAMKGIKLPKEAPQRVELVEEPTQKFGGPTYKQVQPKTYKILQDELGGPVEPEPQAEAAPTPPGMQAEASRHFPQIRPQPQVHKVKGSGFAGPKMAEPSQGPASIFHRNIEDRSDYLVAQNKTIQKAYGQQH